MFGLTVPSISRKEITDKISEADILSFYLGIKKVPCVMNSPFRKDEKPSFSIYSPDGVCVNYIDFATGDRGSCFSLLMKLWNCTRSEVYRKIQDDLLSSITKTDVSITTTPKLNHIKPKLSFKKELRVKFRRWEKYDKEYWESYGVTLEWLNYCNVYPISYSFIIEDNKVSRFKTDKLAYAFVEFKDNKVWYKVYQPHNTRGYKWQSAMDKSVWSLWTKIPEKGDTLIISSSVKDCLNIMCNLKIPAISLQGEGYQPKPSVMEELKSRYKNIIVFYDNDFNNPDNPGRTDSLRLCNKYGLKRIEIPSEYKAKDPSDLYRYYGKEKYLEILKPLINKQL